MYDADYFILYLFLSVSVFFGLWVMYLIRANGKTFTVSFPAWVYGGWLALHQEVGGSIKQAE